MTMTRRLIVGSAIAAGLVGLLPGLAPRGALAAGPQVGKPAPAFSGTDSDGRTVRLEDYRGKVVVLEWTNHECPFVMKHYGGQAMQTLQKKWTEAGILWFSVVSSAPGEQGAVNGQTANRLTQSRGAAPTAVILDAAGTIGRAYDARTTPHMAIVSADGTLLYQGGIDDKPSANLDDLKTAKNFVDAALTEIAAGKPVSVPTARAYGCTVKYAS